LQLLGVCPSPFAIVVAFAANGALDELLYGSKRDKFQPSEELLWKIGESRAMCLLAAWRLLPPFTLFMCLNSSARRTALS